MSKPINIPQRKNQNVNDDYSIKTPYRYGTPTPVNSNRHISYDDDDTAVIATFQKTRTGEVATQTLEDEFVVLGQANSLDVYNDSNANYYGVAAVPFDPNAPYFNETIVQWRLGIMPINTVGTKVYTVKLGNVIDEDVLAQYIDAGATMLKIQDFKVDVVPQQFLESTMGTSSFRIQQGEYFDTVVAKVYESHQTDLNEQLTGLEYEIAIDRQPIPDLLQKPICTLTYKWYATVFGTGAVPMDGNNINLTLLFTTNIQAVLLPITSLGMSKNGYISESQSNKVKLPAKFY